MPRTQPQSNRLTASAVRKGLREKANPEKAAFFPRFFKTGKGQYGEGDKFYGVIVPDQRKIARDFKSLPESEIRKLLDDPVHECRLTALLILVHQFEKGTPGRQKEIYNFYLNNIDRVNNWDLVDASAHKIVGAYLENRSRKPLVGLARTDHLWSQRVAIVATYWFIKKDDFSDTIQISDILLDHNHDLIHKAVGWMLREMGKRNENLLVEFLKSRYRNMPRTMLRYAIEKFPVEIRKKYLDGKI